MSKVQDAPAGSRKLGSRSFRFTFALLALVLLCGFSGLAFADSEEGSEDAGVERIELPGKRTATSNTFELADGTLEAQIFQTPVNYRDEDGDWQPIDPELQETASGAVINGDNNFDVYLPEDLDQAPIRVSVDDQWVSEAPIGLDTEPAELQADGAASYADEGAAARLDYVGLANGLKENIVLADPSAPSTYHFELDASEGVTPILAGDGSIRFEAAGGDLVATMPAPTMADGNGTSAPSDAVSYSLEPGNEGTWILAVTADPDWLADPELAFPVTIDPTTVVNGAERDCAIGSLPAPEGWRACGNDGQTTLSASFDPKTGESARTFLRFATKTSVPKEAFIRSATISLYAPKAAENTSGLELREVTKPWSKYLTWKKYDSAGTKLWTTPGGDFGSETTAQILTSERGSAAGWWNFSSPALANLAKGWREPLPDHNPGVVVKQIDESKTACEANPNNCSKRSVSFNSSAATPAETRPVLSVVYFPAAPSTSKLTSPGEGTRTARRLRLQSGWSVQGVTGITYQFREGKKGFFETIPPNLVRDADGQAVSEWPIAVSGAKESPPLYFDAAHASATLRKKGGSVQVRAVFHGSEGAEGYSRPVETKVDRFLGGASDTTAAVGPGTVDLLTGNLTVSRMDVSISSFNSAFAFSRTHDSRDAGKLGDTGVLGQGWKSSSAVEQAGSSKWRSVRLETSTEEIEEVTYTFSYAILTDLEGSEFSFKKVGETYESPEDSPELKLSAEGPTKLILGDTEGNRTIFENTSGGSEFLPVRVTQTGSAEDNTTQMVYDLIAGGKRRLKMVIGASHTSCTEANATTKIGCRALVFTYFKATKWGAPEAYGDRLEKITYYAPGLGGPWVVAEYSYDSSGRLAAAWDPRISPSLKETYTYESGGQLKTITPAGQKPWTMKYGAIDEEESNGRLMALERESLVESSPVAKTTIAYEVPIGGAGAPYDMSGSQVARWGQEQIPVDATAIFPPDQIPSSPPSSYTRATVYYLSAEGEEVNVATSAGAGTESASISTTETDKFGNIVRELSAQNRLRALAKASKEEEIARAIELDTHRQFSADGIDLLEEWGPLHAVRLSTGTTTQARDHRTVEYDKEAPTPPAGLPMPHLPTRETTGASIPKVGEDKDQLVTETHYDWTLRKPTETIVDPKGPEETKSVTVYNNASGLPVEYRQPSNIAGGGAGSTRIYYWNLDTPGIPLENQCKKNPNENLYDYLPCKILPAAQPGTPGQPQLVVKRFLSYNQLGEPLEVSESPGGGTENVRKTVTTYDAAGRQKTSATTGGGVATPKVESLYNTALGLRSAGRIVCPESEPGCDTQETSASYDALGRPTAYKDADGNEAKTTYDLLGRPATVTDGKGTQTLGYDSVTGLLVELQDSAAGKFTASYDADGQLTKRGLPNGLTAEATFDETGAPVGLAYTKASSCGASCNWLSFSVERSIRGQILIENGNLGKDEFAYDKLSRLTTARETPTGGTCTTRSYKYDKDSNREEMTTTPGLGGVCSGSGGTSQKYSYDSADRLLAEGLTYDSFGRITNLPGSLAGGKALSTTYFSNDMVATQSQNGVTNTFELDAMLRPRQRLQAGGLLGTEIFHYASPSDAPAWTARGSTWTRNIVGIGGELAAIQESGQEVELQLTNLHGDVSATAALSSTATALLSTHSYDEFGNQTAGASSARFGWLGGAQRRTELASGIIQMGARSYVPAIGRFLSPDPIQGGSANQYDYANANPVMGLDLTGLSPSDSECYAGFVGCQCKLWAHMAKGSQRGTLWLTTVRKCNRTGGITLQGISSQWSKRGPYSGGWHDIPAPSRVYPAAEPACRALNDPCQNYQKLQALYYCEPGKEYGLHITWGFVFNLGGEGAEHYLDVSVDQTCPRVDGL